MKFEELKVEDSLIKTCEKNGVYGPTEIQERAIPIILNGGDAIVVSKTGTGKTLAFVLPIISNLLLKDRSFYCLVITPTRELAIQISSCFYMFKSTGLRICILVGGRENFSSQVRALSKKPHVIIGTPGRVAEHILKTKSFKVKRIKKLVLDEADKFFGQDFAEDLAVIFREVQERRQTLLFTATMSDEISKLAGVILKQPMTVQTSKAYETASTLKEYYVFVSVKKKFLVLVGFLDGNMNAKTIVFVSMRKTSTILFIALNNLGVDAEALHGGLDQQEREDVMRRFRCGDFCVLVCTDVGSRGLDVSHVDFVINFDTPMNAKDYVHRVGRTARGGRAGMAITFVTQYDIEQLQRIEYILGRKLENFPSPVEDNCHLTEKEVEEIIESAREKMKENLKTKRHGKRNSRM